MDLKIRPFHDGDIGFGVAQTAREGWDNTPETFRVCLQHDPDGCFIGEVAGRRVGMITTTRYARSAWIGNLIVEPPYRCNGVGERLMRYAMERLEAEGIRTFRLEADPMGVNIYRRLGFVEQAETPRVTKEPPHQAGRGAARPLNASDLATVSQFDTGIFGDDRTRLLGELLRVARAAYCVSVWGRIEGFGMALPSALGVRFGPAVARSPGVAQGLIQSVMADFPRETIIAGAPTGPAWVRDFWELHRFTSGPTTLRMVRGEAEPTRPQSGVIALANGAVG